MSRLKPPHNLIEGRVASASRVRGNFLSVATMFDKAIREENLAHNSVGPIWDHHDYDSLVIAGNGVFVMKTFWAREKIEPTEFRVRMDAAVFGTASFVFRLQKGWAADDADYVTMVDIPYTALDVGTWLSVVAAGIAFKPIHAGERFRFVALVTGATGGESFSGFDIEMPGQTLLEGP